MHELLAHAASLGVSVHVAHLPHPYRGFYDSARKIVVYDFTLPPLERMWVLAHELGHAFFDHQCEDDQALEDAADTYAAGLLIDPVAYARAAVVDSSPDAVSDEIGVHPDAVVVFARTALMQVGAATYTRRRGIRARRLA